MVAVEVCINRLNLVNLLHISLKARENVKDLVWNGRSQKRQACGQNSIQQKNLQFGKHFPNMCAVICWWHSRIHNMPKQTARDHYNAMIQKLVRKEERYFMNQN